MQVKSWSLPASLKASDKCQNGSVIWYTDTPARWGLLSYKWTESLSERRAYGGWSLFLITTSEWFYLLHLLSSRPPAFPWVSADEGSAGHTTPALTACLSVCPESGVTSYYPQVKKEALWCSWTFFSFSPQFSPLFSLHTGGRGRGERLHLLFLTNTSFRIFTSWNRNPSPLNVAWGQMSHTILFSKVSHVYLSFDCVRRE